MSMMQTMLYCFGCTKLVLHEMSSLVDYMPAHSSLEGCAFRIQVGGGNTVSVAVPADKNNNNSFETVETLVFDANGNPVGEPENFSTKDDYINLLVKYVATLREHYGWTPP